MAKQLDDVDEEEGAAEQAARKLENLVQLLIQAHVARTNVDKHIAKMEAEIGFCSACMRRSLALIRGVEEEMLPPWCGLMQGWGNTLLSARKASSEYDGRYVW